MPFRRDMLSPIDRVQVLKYRSLASYLAMLQIDAFADELEFVESELEEQRVRRSYDAIDYYQPDVVKSIAEEIFYIPEKYLSEYPTLIGSALQNFFSHEEVNKFYVLPHIQGSIVGKLNDGYKPLREARQTLKDRNNEDYDEAYEITISSTEKVIRSLFWIVRCDASVPGYIFIQPAKRSYFISLCKYGNLHFYIPPGNDEPILLNLLAKSGLHQWKGKEYERFSKSGKIEERFTIPEE